ncbi:MAG TPA: hypothetical protein DCM10_19495 [Xanthomarina gelatinilytica]|uniref:hypothetical protein n=1 Tax=Xanthomarina sp. TaxID=1931211 RepID=UPI000C685C47|nr:hypothetical protein [Xanthomarina sp.]MAL24174.1 hypothetical protein [Xanthomarina sp.]HAB28714.1 hypothetical protein [Xanthomarina gelatinilytica]HAI20000.1 hypothetical protein [Xanthomarina gelatinilytica]|tara:strand:+ start:671 stop:1297 length:627 start_codon:yes stop_codon:yes gene_type:complete
MAKKRIKISAAYNDFCSQINSLKNFDSTNQTNFQNNDLSKKQLYFLTESIFFNAFREYENLIRDVFILYTQEKKRSNGTKVKSFLKPKDFFHAENLIKSSMQFLDWNTPNTIIDRSELYLKDGYPIKLPYTVNRTELLQYKRLRNHIAHNSVESLSGFKKILRSYYGTNPLKIPSVGEYLMLTSKRDGTKYHLLEFFELLEDMANRIK